MPSEPKRKLAAIMFTDMVGFTAMMQRDEPKTQKLVVKQRDIIKPLVEKHNGKVLQYTGDGTLCTFGSAIEAVSCAVEIQKALINEAEMKIRIGIHIGDIVFEGDDIYGDGVNVASRIEPLAEPGGICVSGQVYDNIKNQPGIKTTSLGSKELKNVERAVEVFALVGEGLPPIKEAEAQLAEKSSIAHILFAKRVPQLLGAYLVFSWGIFQLLNWLVNEYVLSPHLPDFGLTASLSLIPTILMLTYFHGKAGRHAWTKVERIGIPLNLVTAVVVLFVIFQGKDLGAATKTVIVEDENGKKIERVIPKSEFRKNIALYFFDNESGDSTLNWLQHGLSEMLKLDLIQDIFIEIRYAYEGGQSTFYMKMIKAGFAEGIGLPLTLKREIAHDFHLDYFIVGSFTEENDIFTIKTVLYDTESGKPIADNAFEGTDIFELVDAISEQLKRDLEIPDRHIAETTDLPVSEMLTASINAFRSYIDGMNAAIFDNDWNRSVENMENAVRLDPTFSYAYAFLQGGYVLTNQGKKREEVFGPLMQHLYKLPERVRYLVKVAYYDSKADPDKQFGVAKMMVDLYPDDIMGHQLLTMLYVSRGQRDEAISELKRILELDPEQYDVLQQIGSFHKDKGEFEEALKYYKQYADHFPEDYKSFAAIGDLYKTLGNYEEARSYYDKALLIEPEEVSVLRTLADIQLRLGNFEGALKQYEAALIVSKIAQDYVSLYGAFTSFHEEKGEINKALEYMDLRLAMAEKIAPPAFVLLQKLSSLGKYIKAGRDEVAFQTIGTIEAQLGPPFDKFVPLGYLDVYLELGDANNAEKALEGVETLIQTFQLEMLRPMVLNALGKIHEIRDEYEEALISYQKQLELEPTDTRINRRIGRCYRNMGELEKAEEYLNKALKIYPFEPLNNYEIALVYSDMGKREEALEYLRIALEVWRDADPAYKPAKRALDKLTEWESTL